MSLEVRRILLLAALGFIALIIWQTWQREYPSQAVLNSAGEIVQQVDQNGEFVPQYPEQIHPVVNHQQSHTIEMNSSSLISVKTDVFDIAIDPNNGKIVKGSLLKYTQTVKTEKPVQLLTSDEDNYYVAMSGLSDSNVKYHSNKQRYQMLPEQNNLIVTLNGRTKQGVNVTKTLTFHRGSYQINVDYTIKNITESPWSGNFFYQFSRKDIKQKSHGLFDFRPTYLSAAFSYPDKPFDKYKFKKLADTSFSKNVEGGWVAMLQHYFVGAWVPEKQERYHYYTHMSDTGLYTAGFVGPKVEVKSGATLKKVAATKLYLGPELLKQLKQTAPHLELTIDYGWLWMISSFLFKVMKYIHMLVGNWGWSIIILTIIIKLAFYPLSATSYRSMSNMKRLQPQLTALKERYGDDRQKFSQAMMELYRKEGLNPLSGIGGGCFPMLVQIPVFIALYWVLLESVELRQAPFMLWIQDLAAKDPYYVLPVIMGATMLLQQRLSPAPPDPTQAKVMMMMPIVFTFLFVSFPAGLVLYWVINNSFGIVQQWYVMRQFDAKRQRQKYRKK